MLFCSKDSDWSFPPNQPMEYGNGNHFRFSNRLRSLSVVPFRSGLVFVFFGGGPTNGTYLIVVRGLSPTDTMNLNLRLLEVG
jgi:hypothetical protein